MGKYTRFFQGGNRRFRFQVSLKYVVFDCRTLLTFCYSYQGQMNYLVNTGASEQPLVITGGPNGCLDGSLHNIMKYFAIVLGKRNEHQRGITRFNVWEIPYCKTFLLIGDRDRYITVYDQNIIVPVRIKIHRVLFSGKKLYTDWLKINTIDRIHIGYTTPAKPYGLFFLTTFVPSRTTKWLTMRRQAR